MKEKFKQWLLKQGKTGAAISYPLAISIISEHYSKETGNKIDIYSITDQKIISQLAHDYSQAGKYSTFGYEHHGRFRAAIGRYSEFFVYNIGEVLDEKDEDAIDSGDNVLNLENTQTNFSYEKDLKTTLCAQISELFPEHKILGDKNQGVEYSIGGRRIDIILEHIDSGDLLVVELKSGVADFRAFGQIAMYIGLLKNQFSDKLISGVIVAGTIDDSLKQACEITDKISLKTYRMLIELEDA